MQNKLLLVVFMVGILSFWGKETVAQTGGIDTIVVNLSGKNEKNTNTEPTPSLNLDALRKQVRDDSIRIEEIRLEKLTEEKKRTEELKEKRQQEKDEKETEQKALAEKRKLEKEAREKALAEKKETEKENEKEKKAAEKIAKEKAVVEKKLADKQNKEKAMAKKKATEAEKKASLAQDKKAAEADKLAKEAATKKEKIAEEEKIKLNETNARKQAEAIEAAEKKEAAQLAQQKKQAEEQRKIDEAIARKEAAEAKQAAELENKALEKTLDSSTQNDKTSLKTTIAEEPTTDNVDKAQEKVTPEIAEKNLPEIPDGVVQEDNNFGTVRLAFDDNAASFLLSIPKETKMHYHKDHSEHIMLVEGEGLVLMGYKTIKLKRNELIFVTKGTPHKIINSGKDKLKVLSIQSPFFDGTDTIILE